MLNLTIAKEATLYAEAQAMEIADELGKGDPDWCYEVAHHEGNRFRVDVIDEDGHFVGSWSEGR